MSSNSRLSIEEALNLSDAKRLLILTYHLQGEALLRAINREAPRSFKTWAKLESLDPVIIYDGKITGRLQVLPPSIELLPHNVRGGLHHSKAWCKLAPNKIELTLGSFNLTEPGIYLNRELFRSFCWTPTDLSGSAMIKEFLEFVQDSIGPWREDGRALNEFIKEAVRMISTWDYRPSTTKVLSSGYKDQDGLSLLIQEWKKNGATTVAKELVVVSPFFDTDPQNTFLDEIIGRELISESTHLTLMTAPNQHNILPMFRAYAKKWEEFKGGSSLYLSKKKIEKEDPEWSEINAIAKDRLDEDLRKDYAAFRDLHAKLLAIYDGKRWLVYCGSANFTRNAWLGTNRELGWTEWLDLGKEQFISGLAEGLNAKALKWSEISSAVNPEELGREEEAEDFVNFPDCITGVKLFSVDSNLVQFRFAIDLEVQPQIESYKIRWGNREIVLQTQPDKANIYLSQTISLIGNVELLAQQNLELCHIADAEFKFFYPFVFDEVLREKRLLAMYSSSDEWLSKYLSPHSTGPDFIIDELGGDPNEIINIANDALSASLRAVNRDNNKTIAIQRFLTQYLVLEKTFFQRVQDYLAVFDKDGGEQLGLFSQVDPSSLIHYIKLLERELLNETGDYAAALFKLGEALALLEKGKSLVTIETVRAQFAEPINLVAKCVSLFIGKYPDLSKRAMFKTYIDMISRKIVNGAVA